MAAVDRQRMRSWRGQSIGLDVVYARAAHNTGPELSVSSELNFIWRKCDSRSNGTATFDERTDNSMCVDGARALSEALKINTTLTKLELDCDHQQDSTRHG